MKSSRKTSILLLIAMGLALSPAHLSAAYFQAPEPISTSCETLPSDSCGGCGDTPDQDVDNCCDADCLQCSSPCCAGTAMLPTIAQALDSTLIVDDYLAVSIADIAWVDADPHYHPPRT